MKQISFIASLGLGALVGLLLGLSASPLVAAVAAAVLPFALGFATWFSQKPVEGSGRLPTALGVSYATVVAGFAWGAFLATLSGVALRTHGWLSPTPAAFMQQWKTAGFTEAEAKLLTMH